MNCKVCGEALPTDSPSCMKCGAPNDLPDDAASPCSGGNTAPLTASGGDAVEAQPQSNAKTGAKKILPLVLIPAAILLLTAVVIAVLITKGIIGGSINNIKRGTEPVQVEIPGGGKQIEITGATDVTFSPKESAFYVIFTSNSGSSDPVLELYDAKGSLIKTDDNSYGDGNAMIYMYLTTGQTYRISVRFNGDSGESCTFRVFSPIKIPGDGCFEIVRDWGVISFTPMRSGMWQFDTVTLDEKVDPYLRLYDIEGNIIAEDDNSGDGNNASMAVELAAGETYGIYMSSYGSGIREFVLAVSD